MFYFPNEEIKAIYATQKTHCSASETLPVGHEALWRTERTTSDTQHNKEVPGGIKELITCTFISSAYITYIFYIHVHYT